MGESSLPYISYIYTQSLRAEGVYIRQTTLAYVTNIMCHLVIGYKLMYVTNDNSKH